MSSIKFLVHGINRKLKFTEQKTENKKYNNLIGIPAAKHLVAKYNNETYSSVGKY